MKNLYLHSSLALACALGVAACGGKGGNLAVGGGVVGLQQPGLVLQNNLKDPKPIDTDGQFYFQNIDSDEAFDITVKTLPPNTTCNVTGGKGTTGAYTVNSVYVQCMLKQQNVGGRVNDLRTDGLVVVNGTNRVTIPANATSWTLTTKDDKGVVTGGQVGQTQQYGVLVLRQPDGQTCTIDNSVGIVGTGDVGNVNISCTPR